jgi:hypothetical protein
VILKQVTHAAWEPGVAALIVDVTTTSGRRHKEERASKFEQGQDDDEDSLKHTFLMFAPVCINLHCDNHAIGHMLTCLCLASYPRDHDCV